MLSSVIEGATSDSVSVSALLRRVQVVGTRLGSGDLTSWVHLELNGYEFGTHTVPPYRGPFETAVIGRFVGPFNSQVELAVPSLRVPPLPNGTPVPFDISFYQPIAELEELAKSEKQLQSPWPANVIAFLNGKIDRGELTLVEMHNIHSAYRVITPAQLSGVIDSVKTRVLGLALDLERLDPDVGELRSSPLALSHDSISTIVNNNIYGSNNNISISSSDVQQRIDQVKQGDIESLLTVMRALGATNDEILEVRAAIESDDAEGNRTDAPGPHVRSYLGDLALKPEG